MRTLLAYELRKIWNRKVLWVALALGVVLWVQVRGIYIIRDGLSGSPQGMKDVIAQYEGQVLTDALQARMQRDYDGYVAAHVDRFGPEPVPEGEPPSGRMAPVEMGTGYDYGVYLAYGDLIGGRSLEDLQQTMRQIQQMLAAGVDQNGEPLTRGYRRRLSSGFRSLMVTPVVHYTEGWKEFFQTPNENGQWVLLATVVALLGLFGGEASTRMEAIFLSARDRQRAVTAKLLAAGIVAGGSVALFFGLHFAAFAFAWGLQGALLPATAIRPDFANMHIVAFFSLSVLALVLDAVACGAVVAWASARFRHALLTLLVAGAILAGMALLWQDNGSVLHQQLGLWQIPDNLIRQSIDWFVYALPVNTLMDNCYSLAYSMGQTATAILHLALPLALSVLFFFLARRAFLRRRKV